MRIADLTSDPKILKYEGDIKAAIIEEIETHKTELGLTLPYNELVRIVDSTVTREIGRLLEFNRSIRTITP